MHAVVVVPHRLYVHTTSLSYPPVRSRAALPRLVPPRSCTPRSSSRRSTHPQEVRRAGSDVRSDVGSTCDVQAVISRLMYTTGVQFSFSSRLASWPWLIINPTDFCLLSQARVLSRVQQRSPPPPPRGALPRPLSDLGTRRRRCTIGRGTRRTCTPGSTVRRRMTQCSRGPSI